MLLEGKHAVAEALRAGMPLKSILIAEGTAPDRSVAEIERLAAGAGVAVTRAKRRELDERSERGAHQGVIAEARPFKYARLEDVIAPAEAAESLIIALDHVTDPGNFGAIVRTAEVVGAHGVVVPNRRSAAVTAAAWKAAAGAFAHLPIAQTPNLASALESLKKAGYWVAGASERARADLWKSPMEGRLVLVMGAEGTGLARLTAERCDFLVSLPQAGNVGSLNVAQATTALAYEWMRRIRSGV